MKTFSLQTNTAGPPPGQVPATPYGSPSAPSAGSSPFPPGLNPIAGIPWGPGHPLFDGPRGNAPQTPQTPQSGGRIIGDDSPQGIGQIYPNPTTLPPTNQPPPQTIQQPNPSIPPPTTGGNGTIPTTTPPATQQPPTPSPMSGNINTSITPLVVYPEELMNAARNQIVATQAQASDPRWLTKRFASPGRSIDAGIGAAAMPFLAQSQFLGNQGYAQQSLGDYLANQESLMAGEVAREREGLGLGNLLARLNEGQISSTNSFLSPLLNQLLN